MRFLNRINRKSEILKKEKNCKLELWLCDLSKIYYLIKTLIPYNSKAKNQIFDTNTKKLEEIQALFIDNINKYY